MASKKVLIRIINRTEGFLGLPEEMANYGSEGEGEDALSELDEHLGLGFENNGEIPSMLETEAELESENGRITLSYYTELIGAPSLVKYSFFEDDRDSLTVTRKQMLEDVYFFDGRSRRQTVIYNEESGAVEFSLYTKRLRNQLTYELGGFLEIEYYAEVRGGVVEHCREYVFVEPSV